MPPCPPYSTVPEYQYIQCVQMLLIYFTNLLFSERILSTRGSSVVPQSKPQTQLLLQVTEYNYVIYGSCLKLSNCQFALHRQLALIRNLAHPFSGSLQVNSSLGDNGILIAPPTLLVNLWRPAHPSGQSPAPSSLPPSLEHLCTSRSGSRILKRGVNFFNVTEKRASEKSNII